MEKIYSTNWPHCAGIYKIINIQNQKVYIGSAVDLFKRLRRHNRELLYNYHWCTHLLNAYNKYGKDSLEVEILETFENINYEDLLKKEDFYILKYNALNKDFGYNSKTSDTFTILSPDVKIKQSINRPMTKKGIIICNKSTGKFIKEFDSIAACSNELKTSRSNIKVAKDNIHRFCKNYIIISKELYDPTKLYKYEKPILTRTPEVKEKMRIANNKRITCYSYDYTGNCIIYSSWRNAEIKNNFKPEELRKFREKKEISFYKNKLWSTTPINLDDFDEIWNKFQNT